MDVHRFLIFHCVHSSSWRLSNSGVVRAPTPLSNISLQVDISEPFPIIHSVKHMNIFLCILYVMVLAGSELLQRVQLLYVLWTVHRDTHRWEWPTRCTLFLINLFQLTFRHRASCILGQAFHYSPENAFYIFNQQIYFIIWYLLDRASLI